MLEEAPRDIDFCKNLDIPNSCGTLSPSGRFFAYVSPKISGINDTTQLIVRDLMSKKSKVCSLKADS
jgi:hypothetical protein